VRDEHTDEDEVPVPLAALLRSARTVLAHAIHSALSDAGYDDLPVNGPYAISAAAGAGIPLAQIIGRLGLSKQAAGHLVDLLVLRGYLDRHVDPEDRRRLVVSPTERGTAAAQVIRSAADGVETQLVTRVGPRDLQSTRRTLACLAALGDDDG
jgi:DNA-binding MarR family transcriptional regulator